MAKIALCIPSQDTWKAPTGTFIAAIALDAERAGHRVNILSHERSVISENRNDIVRHVLSMGNDYIMWVDSDMVGPASLLTELIKCNVDIVGVRYPRRSPPNDLLGEVFADQNEKHELRLAKSLPGGLMLVKTDVYRASEYPWYFIVNTWNGNDGPESFSHQLFQSLPVWAGPEMREKLEAVLRSDEDVANWLDRNKLFLGGHGMIAEDIAFSKKVRMYGFEMWSAEKFIPMVGHITTVPIVFVDQSTYSAAADGADNSENVNT